MVTSPVVHIVGAGLAGLATALGLTRRGITVQLYEANAFAGGRCRTYWDARLERKIDNGNHLLLTGNRSAKKYLDETGGASEIQTAPIARFPFSDVRSGMRWQVQMNRGIVPWWVFSSSSRVPGTSLMDYAAMARLAVAGRDRTVAQTVRRRGHLWNRFWEPLTMAVLNTTPDRGSANLLWSAMSETFARGGDQCRPMFAANGLGAALIDPALSCLAQRGAATLFEHQLIAIETAADRITSLRFSGGVEQSLNEADRVVLALPPTRLKSILPWATVPNDDAAILNAHFCVANPESLNSAPPLLGLVSATSHWIFVRGDVVSTTISAADRLGLMDLAPDALIPRLWAEAKVALGIPDLEYRSARINKERRATIDQSPAQAARRPAPRTPLRNLFLAGDATDTGLPATIEGAIRSGETAARLAA